MKRFTKAIIAGLLTICLILGLTACGNQPKTDDKTFTVGICNYVDDASLNQICDAIQAELKKIGEEKGYTFNVRYDNANADANLLSQIATTFTSSKVDCIVAVATPVAITMQTATEDNKIPVVFAAVSDPVSTGIVDSLENPGANITGTSDALNTKGILELMLLQNPELKKVGLLYDLGQDSSTTAISEAKAFLDEKSIEYVVRTGTTVDEVALAAQALVNDGVQAVFTPTDNTIMQAELTIAETFTKAGILHYAGADSFALNGAFLGYGVNYENLGKATGEMVADLLINKKNPKDMPVVTFDNGIAMVNEDVCKALNIDKEAFKALIKDKCSDVLFTITKEAF